MARLAFSKAALHQQTAQLKRYQHYLPSLDLKRQQLTAQQAQAKRHKQHTQHQIEQLNQTIGERLPMLAHQEVDLNQLVQINQVNLGSENLVGVELPVLKSLDIDVQAYSYLAKPHWVDALVVELTAMLELQMQLQVQQQRYEILKIAVKKVTQRVNLFDKVLIPQARENIKKIRIFLSDMETAAVVRAKMTKAKHKH